MTGLSVSIGYYDRARHCFIPQTGFSIPSLFDALRDAARSADLYRALHTSALGQMRERRAKGSLSGRGAAILQADLAAYRRMFGSYNAHLARLRDRQRRYSGSLLHNDARCDSFESVATGVGSNA